MQYDLSFLMHHVFVCPFFGRLKFLVFLPYTEPPKKVCFVKNQLLLKAWTSSKFSGLILLTNIKPLYIMACLKELQNCNPCCFSKQIYTLAHQTKYIHVEK